MPSIYAALFVENILDRQFVINSRHIFHNSRNPQGEKRYLQY